MRHKKKTWMFLAGLMGIISGLIHMYITAQWHPGAIGLCSLGVIAAGVASFKLLHVYPLHVIRSVTYKAGFMAAVTVAAIVVFVGINYLALLLPGRVDITRAKQHTLSSSTTAFIQSLRQEVKFAALYVGTPPIYVQDMFKEYERVSNGRISTEIIDPIEQIGYAAQFGNIINGKESKVVVRSGKERRDVDFTKDPLTEEQLTTAIARVTRQERHICFLTGHGEYAIANKGDQGLTAFVAMLADNNMVSEDVMLGVVDKVPDHCDVVVVAGAQQSLALTEEAKIGTYLKKGGDALFLIENVVVTTPDNPLTAEDLHKNPSLNKVLNPWGINVEEDVVVDLSNHAGDDVGSPATRNYVRHKAITEGLDYTFYVRPRQVTPLKNRRPSIKLAPIVLTMPGSSNSWAETNRMLKIHYDPSVDTPGPVALAYVAMDPKTDNKASDTRIIVFTDADFLTNIFIDQYSNAQMGLNVINWLSETYPEFTVEPKKINVERLDLNSQHKRIITVILLLMPVMIAMIGIGVWMKR